MYHLAINRVQSGPFDETEIRRRIASGELRPQDLCWQAGWPLWRRIDEVFPSQPALPPQLPPTVPGIVPPAAGARGAAVVTSGWAIGSLICGICVFLFWPLFFLVAPAAIVCGHLAKARIRRSAGRMTGSGLATAGLALGYGGGALLLAAATAIGVTIYHGHRREMQETTVRNNLSELWQAAERRLQESEDETVSFEQLVGEGRALAESDLKVVAGEDYHGLVVRRGDESVSVTLGDGRVVDYYAGVPIGVAVSESATEEPAMEDDEEAVAPPEASEPAPATEPEA